MEPNQEQPKAEIPNEIKDQRLFAVLGYIIPILFFIPLLSEKTKNAPFARFHANQQCLLLIVTVAVQFLVSNMFGVFMSVMFLIDIIFLVLLALVVFGAYYAYKGEMKELPLIGHFRLL